MTQSSTRTERQQEQRQEIHDPNELHLVRPKRFLNAIAMPLAIAEVEVEQAEVLRRPRKEVIPAIPVEDSAWRRGREDC